MHSLYFAFADGVFDYVCPECTAICCKGRVFGGSLDREMGALFQIYPSLQSAVVARRGQVVSVAIPDRCYFLEADNLCRVEKEHGQGMKPGLCVLFPFNDFALIGDTLVVRPHFLCPLRLHVPPRPGAVEGTHARLEIALRESRMVEESFLKTSLKPLQLHPSEGVRSVLAREVSFRDRCAAALGTGTFFHCISSAAGDPARLEERISQAAAVMGLPPVTHGDARDPLDDMLLAVAPSVRISLLRLPADGILLALALAGLMARRVAALSATPTTPQDVADLISGVTPAVSLLGLDGVPVQVVRQGRTQIPPFGDSALVFAAFRVMKRAHGSERILDILEEEMRAFSSGADRNAFLMEMAARIRPASRRRARQAPSTLEDVSWKT